MNMEKLNKESKEVIKPYYPTINENNRDWIILRSYNKEHMIIFAASLAFVELNKPCMSALNLSQYMH